MSTRSFAVEGAALLLLAAIALILLVLVGHVRAEPLTTYRDSMGQVHGYATTRGNTTTYEDAMGRQTGRSEAARRHDNLLRRDGAADRYCAASEVITTEHFF